MKTKKNNKNEKENFVIQNLFKNNREQIEILQNQNCVSIIG